MKRWGWLYALALSLLLATPAYAVTTGNVNVFFGEKHLDDNDWASPYDEQGEFGILFDIRGDNWPVSIAVDLLGSARTVDYWWGDATASTSELDLGVRKIFDIPGTALHPYVGGGLALVTVRYEETDAFGTLSTEEGGTGLWLNGGIYWTIGYHFNVGLEARISRADVEFNDTTLGNVTVDGGGNHGGITLGYHW